MNRFSSYRLLFDRALSLSPVRGRNCCHSRIFQNSGETIVKSSYKLLAAGIAGLFIGAASNSVIHSAQVKTPPFYMISEADTITASAAIKNYRAKVPSLVPRNKDRL
jgi:hypothetical protein